MVWPRSYIHKTLTLQPGEQNPSAREAERYASCARSTSPPTSSSSSTITVVRFAVPVFAIAQRRVDGARSELWPNAVRERRKIESMLCTRTARLCRCYCNASDLFCQPDVGTFERNKHHQVSSESSVAANNNYIVNCTLINSFMMLISYLY